MGTVAVFNFVFVVIFQCEQVVLEDFTLSESTFGPDNSCEEKLQEVGLQHKGRKKMFY